MLIKIRKHKCQYTKSLVIFLDTIDALSVQKGPSVNNILQYQYLIARLQKANLWLFMFKDFSTLIPKSAILWIPSFILHSQATALYFDFIVLILNKKKLKEKKRVFFI